MQEVHQRKQEIQKKILAAKDKLSRCEKDIQNLGPRIDAGEDLGKIDREAGILLKRKNENMIKIHNLENELIELESTE